ncbi:MAG: ion transporter [Deltaproteobacteria bacterium]|nr:ion transporter [Deltaproteobacteria bacterium]
MYKSFKNKIFNILYLNKNSFIGLLFNYFIVLLIFLNIVLLIVESFDDFFIDVNYSFEYFTVIIFSLEYLARLWTADLLYPDLSAIKSRVHFAFSFLAIIDLIAILPFFIPMLIPVNLISLRSLRLIRLFRLLKLTRHTDALLTVAAVLRNKFYQLISSLIVVFIIILIASIVMYNVEYAAQPTVFNNAFSSFWWAIATITTVGYGDIYPVTVTGRILSSIISFLGIALVAIPTGIISAGFNELTDKTATDEYNFCPYCGRKLTKNGSKEQN